MDLSIITVTHNDKDQMAGQLESVESAARDISVEQWVVDNGSEDGTAELVSKNFPEVNIIKNSDNTGFGRANNQAAKKSAGDFFLFLNPDMRLEERGLDKIVAWMRAHPEVGIASCKLIYENGKFNENAKPRRFPRLSDQIAILLKLPHIFPNILGGYLYKDFDENKEQEVDTVRGSFMLMRRSLYEKLGWAFDPRYFIWFEDVDTCRECRKLGMKVVYTPIISCVDYVGQSFKKMPVIWKQKNFTKSMLQYFQKWEPWYKWIWVAALRPVAIAFSAINKK
ncbi:MAG: glycosyltransferase family 2 protein [Candidatus Magasanikbacteria bacterium]|nr:glycosyltransferase family 2 protein [Candidatus Magasanikbacteria bacterium]